MRHRSRLLTKFSVLTALAVLVTSLGIMAFAVRQARENSLAALVEHGITLALFVSKSSEYGIYTQDPDTLGQILADLDVDPQVAYAAILDPEGRVLASRSRSSRRDAPPTRLPQREQGRSAPEVRFAQGPDGEEIEILASVYGASADPVEFLLDSPAGETEPSAVLGYVQIFLTQARLREYTQTFLSSAAVVVPILVLLGVGLTVVLVRRTTQPIRKLASVAQTISEGNIDIRSEVTTRDEVGELAHSFNLMLDRLGSYRDEVENQNRVLESKVSERTADLQEATEQAIESARQARDASQAKSQFLASMSHEIRTPLNGVLGNIDLLQNSNLDARQRRFAESAYRSSEMLLGLVTDILDFSKIEAGKLELESLDFDVRELIEDVVVLMAPRAHVKGLELFCSVGVDVPRNLCGDPGRLRQILVNLVANAIKFTEVGRVVLCVDVEEPGDSEVDLRFDVEDTGIGISAEAQHRLFESFAQADGSTTRKYGGTGLGLAIAKQLSGLMGGTIGVESESGQGSRFWFTAHLALGKSQEPGPEAEGVAERLRELEAGVASASEKLAQHVCDQLDSWGMRASRFESGSQALELLRRRCDSASRLHVLIVDAELPDMSGAELAAAIRSDPRIESTRLILLTPLGARGQVAAHTSAKIDAYVTKPILQSRLYNAVLTVLELVPSREALATDAPASVGVVGLRVLVVDDNPVNLDLGVAMLQALSCRADTATSGQEALDSFEPGRYDAILMDCQMPGLDGYETTRRIRELEHRHSDESVGRIPIIAVTANAIEGDRERCLAADMNDYLAKPFVLKQLSETLRRWFEGELSPEGAPGSDLPEGDAERELSSALDPEVLDGIRELQQDGASDLVIGVAKTYLESSETLLERLRTAAEALDPVELHQAAHGLKGSSANLGARELAELCRQLDEYARDDAAESAARLLASLENEYERVRLELASLIAAGA